MLELIQKIKDYTEAGIILEHMELFDEVRSMTCGNCIHMNTERFCYVVEGYVERDDYCSDFEKDWNENS